MAEQLALFDVADCIKGGLKTNIGQLAREAGTTRSGLTGETGYDMVGRLAENVPAGLKEPLKGFRAALKKYKGPMESIYYTNLLSNPTTFERNAIGNAIEVIMESGARGLRGVAEANPGQAVAQFNSVGEGVRHAWQQAGKAWAAGRPQLFAAENELIEMAAQGDVSGIKGVLKTIPRLMAATDDFFTTLGFHMSAQDRVYREAFKRVGDTNPAAVKSEAAKLWGNLPQDIMDDSIKDARRGVFRDIPESEVHKMFLDSFTGLKEKLPFGRFIVPFVKTPINLAKRGIEYTPLNMMYGFGQMLSTGNKAGQMNVYRGLMGTSLMGWFGHMAYNGKISGDGGHLSPGERSAKMAAGWQPSAMKFGDKWMSYRNFGPITTLMTIAGNVGERAKDTGVLSMETYFGPDANVITDTIKGVVDSTFLPTLVEYGTALAYPERYGEKGIQNLLRTLRSQVIPSGLPSLMRALDPTIRERATIGEQITAPLSTLIGGKPRLGLFGEELSRTGAFSDNFPDIFLNPARATKVAEDPLILEVARLQDVGIEGSGFMPPSISDTSLGFKKDTLTEDEIFMGSRAKGFVQRALMGKVLQSQNYTNLDDIMKLRLLRRMYDRAGRITNLRIRNLKRQAKPLTYREIVQGFE